MSNHRENYRGVPDRDFEIMPEGEYQVEVLKSSIGASKSSGNLTWCLELGVLDRRYVDRKLWFYISMSEKAKSMRKGAITAMGLDPESDVDLIDDVITHQAKAVVFHDTFNGRTREKVRRLRSLAQVAPGQMTIDDDLDDSTPF